MSKPIRVAGKLYFTRWMSEFNTHFNPDNTRYECTVGDISDKAQQAMKDELQVKPKNKEQIGNFFVGKSKNTFKVVDEDGNVIPTSKLGTGTEVIVWVDSYEHRMSKAHGLAPSIKKVIVTKLVEFDASDRVEEGTEFSDVL
jgi:hypothetical protein